MEISVSLRMDHLNSNVTQKNKCPIKQEFAIRSPEKAIAVMDPDAILNIKTRMKLEKIH